MQKNLNKKSILLANTEEELKKCRYTLKEKDFVISEQRKAGMLDCVFLSLFILLLCLLMLIVQVENALTHQACILRADLEKALQDNASLFSKIGKGSHSFHCLG